MPTNVFGLLLLAVSITPGLCYFSIRDRRLPQREVSSFRETGVVLLVSLFCDVLATVVFACIRWCLPSHTPDVGALVATGGGYFKVNFAYVSWWALTLLSLASLLGALLGRLERVRIGRWVVELGPIRFISAWHLLFAGMANSKIYCGCELDDGSWTGGYLRSYSTEVKESGDRDLVLSPPITVRTPSGAIEERFVSAVVLSGRRIVRLEVAYVPIGAAGPGATRPEAA